MQTNLPVLAIHGTADKITLWEGDPQNRDDSTEVKLYELTGGGHELPRFIANELPTAETIWKFFIWENQ